MSDHEVLGPRISPLGSIRGDLSTVPACQRPGISIRELPFGVHQVLRFDPRMVRVGGSLKLPERMNSAVTGPFGLLAWIGPDDWWLWSGDRADGKPIVEGTVVTDVSHGHTAIEVAGAGAAELLVRGTPLDLHPGVFILGAASRTHIDKAPVLLVRSDVASSFYVVVRRSFAKYLWDWLRNAALDLDV